jgi:hypothetical protein
MWVQANALHFLPLDQAPAWYEAFHDVPVVFLAVPDKPSIEVPIPSTMPDLFYVDVAVNRLGVPIDHRRLTNLTSSPVGREQILGRSGATVAISTEVLGQIQTVSLLDFRGDRSPVVIQEGTSRWLGELMISLDNLQRTGRWQGVDRRDFVLTRPTSRIEVEQSQALLELGLFNRDQAQGVVGLSVDTGEIARGAELLQESPQPPHQTGDPLAWAANWVRNLEWVGPERIAVLERLVFQLSDHIKQRLYAWFGYAGGSPMDGLTSANGGLPPTIVLADFGTADTSGEWPPPPIEQTLRFSESLENEGQWSVASPQWLRVLPGAPPAFLQTYLRTDRDRPYVWVLILAMDLRQIDVRYQQGTDHPHATTGLRGSGEIPRDDDTMSRLLGAFNGGFKTTHGIFGSMVDDTVYIPPIPWRATVAWTDDSDAMLMGTWGEDSDIPEEVVSLRQNLSPLDADGEVNPTRRPHWFADNDANYNTFRSGICFRGHHTLYYFWSADAVWQNMARAMNAANCEYGIHLDMNPRHTGWEFYRIEDFAAGVFEWVRPTREMRFSENRYLEADDKDYFYLLLRQTLADLLPPLAGASWQDEGMPTTSDGFLTVSAQASIDGGLLQLLALDTHLLETHFVLGTGEPLPPTGAYRPQPTVELTAPRIMLSFWATGGEPARGLTLDSWNYFPPSDQGIWLIYDQGRLSLVEIDRRPIDSSSGRSTTWPLESPPVFAAAAWATFPTRPPWCWPGVRWPIPSSASTSSAWKSPACWAAATQLPRSRASRPGKAASKRAI